MTDTTTTTVSAQTELQKIEAELSAFWAAIIAFFKKEEANLANFLTAAANGAPIFIADVHAIADTIAGKVSSINAAAAAMGTVATSIDPGSASTVQKLLADINVGLTDAAALSIALKSGASANDPTIVTQAVNTINAVNTLSQLAGVAGAALSAAVAASPSATTAVTPGTPGAASGS